MKTQADKAAQLRALHHRDEPLVLVNAWDAITARIVESLEYPAIATTSAGIAFAHGFADGGDTPRAVMLDAVATIARTCHVPVTADMEAGYGTTVEAAIETAYGVIDAGAVGLNFEDEANGAFIDVDAQVARIAAIRKVGVERGVPLVINARTDVYWHGTADEPSQLDAAIERGKRYLAAGADCIFIPGLAAARSIERAVRELGGPLNVLAMPDTPPLHELRNLGVARLSYGSSPISFTMAVFRDTVRTVRDRADNAFVAKRIPYDELNAFFK